VKEMTVLKAISYKLFRNFLRIMGILELIL
jgi:hypothetical protein